MASGTIKTKYSNAGFKNGTVLRTTVPSQNGTNVMSMTLPAGKWLIIGHCGFTSSFEELTILSIYRRNNVINTSVVRSTGSSGGGQNSIMLYDNQEEAVFYLQVWQGNASTKTVDQLLFRALRVG